MKPPWPPVTFFLVTRGFLRGANAPPGASSARLSFMLI